MSSKRRKSKPKRKRWGLAAYVKRKQAEAARRRKRDIVYNCIHFPLIFLAKIGITHRQLDQRMREIDSSIPGFLIPIVWPRLRRARKIEKRIHSWSPRIPFVGSGKTEYRLSLVLLLSVPYVLLCWDWQQFKGALTLLLGVIIYIYSIQPV